MQSVQNDDVVEIDLQELFGLLLHWLWLILLCGIVTGILGFAISHFLVTPQYESTTKVYILNKQDNSTLTYSDVQLGTQLTKDYAQLIKSRTVLEQVISTCALEDTYEAFAGRVNVETLTDTRIIAITVTDPDPIMAQLLANEIRKIASEHIKNVMDIQAVNVAEEANLPSVPASPNVARWTAIGFLIGLSLCAVVLVVRFLLDDTIKTSEDVEKYLELSTLAMIPVIEDPMARKKSRGRRYGREVAAEKSGSGSWSEGADRNDETDRKETYRSTESHRKETEASQTANRQEKGLVIEELDPVVNGKEQ